VRLDGFYEVIGNPQKGTGREGLGKTYKKRLEKKSEKHLHRIISLSVGEETSEFLWKRNYMSNASERGKPKNQMIGAPQLQDVLTGGF